MPLIQLDLPVSTAPIPREVRAFLREAERRIEEFQRERLIAAFVPSNFTEAYQVLRALAAAETSPGRLFCEWGSGFGVVACLAAMLEYDACGIEIEGELVEAAQQLADDFSLPVHFHHGSFLPPGANAAIDPISGFAWLTMIESDPLVELGLAPDDFQVIFAYPWPDEEYVANDLFERFGADGAVLVTFHGGDEFRVQRKRPNSFRGRRGRGMSRRSEDR